MLTTIAGVVGLGNIWRFPYMAGQHDGGSFLVAYLTCVVIVAVPLAALESAAGSLARCSPVGSFRRVGGRRTVVFGWAAVLVPVAILSYYLVVTGWTFGYTVDAFRGTLGTFDDFVGGYTSLWLLLLVGAGVLLVMLRGVEALERASMVLAPVLVVGLLGLAVYALSLDGSAEARTFLFGVRADRLFDPATWQAAAGQAFFSLGVGQGMLIAYGSFVPAGTNLVRSTATIAVTNSLVSVISGVLVFSLAFTFGIAPTEGSQLSFTVLPEVFGQMAGGRALAIVFFTSLFLAGFTSCLAMALVVVTAVRDEWRLPRRSSAALTVGVVVLLGVPSALSFTEARWTIGGRPILDVVDQATGSAAIVVLGLTGAAALARGLPWRTLTAALGADPVRIGGLEIGPRLVVTWARVLPLVAAVIYLVATVV